MHACTEAHAQMHAHLIKVNIRYLSQGILGNVLICNICEFSSNSFNFFPFLLSDSVSSSNGMLPSHFVTNSVNMIANRSCTNLPANLMSGASCNGPSLYYYCRKLMLLTLWRQDVLAWFKCQKDRGRIQTLTQTQWDLFVSKTC